MKIVAFRKSWNPSHLVNRWQSLVAVGVVSIIILTGFAVFTGETIIWKFEKLDQVGQLKPEIIGTPRIVTEAGKKAVSFNGINDGLVLSEIPIAGWPGFTIEVLFKPLNHGPAAPRFIHFEDHELNRGTFELRLTSDGQWYMDTFLKNGKTDQGLTLIDSSLLHPANKWYWAALVYDGKTMTSYVDRKKELQGVIDFPAMGSGRISLGVRLNKINWFRGLISEVRFHSTAIDTAAMQHL